MIKRILGNTYYNFEFFLSLKYMLSKKNNKFISLITMISVLAVAIGVTALVSVLSVMAGFEDELKSKMLGSHAPVLLLKYAGSSIDDYERLSDKVSQVKGVTGVSPVIIKEGMLIAENGLTAGVMVNGVDVNRAPSVSEICKLIDNAGKLKALESTGADGIPAIIISQGLSRQLVVGTGEVISLLSPFGEITPFGNQPRIMKFRIGAIFESGLYEFEAKFVYLSLLQAQNFFSYGETVNEIDINVNNIDNASAIASEINVSLGAPYYTRDWTDYSANLLDALKLEKTVMFVILTMIILVAAFNIIAMLIMIVMEKGKDIAILKSMGASNKSVMKIFITVGMLIGFFGTSLGLILGYGVSLFLKEYIKFPLNPQVYYISTLPVKIVYSDYLAVAAAALIICFLATIYPSWKASRLTPIDGLRYE
ncbi:MAG: FtsX-like permease family protein [Pseudomonadota bacterium]